MAGRRLERVSDLVEGFESDLGLELLATVHWIVSRESAWEIREVVSRTHDWDDGKQRFTGRQIGLALRQLSEQG